MIKTLLGSLFLAEKMTTTEARAREIAPLAEKIISKAKKIGSGNGAKMTTTRELRGKIPARAAEKITGDFLNKFNKRSSGYTRIIKLPPRKSDSAKMAVIEFV